jgi:hypothetical protein
VPAKNTHYYKINSILLKFTQVIGKLLKSPTSSYKCSKKVMFRELFVIFQIIQILKQMQYFVLMQIYEHILLG